MKRSKNLKKVSNGTLKSYLSIKKSSPNRTCMLLLLAQLESLQTSLYSRCSLNIFSAMKAIQNSLTQNIHSCWIKKTRTQSIVTYWDNTKRKHPLWLITETFFMLRWRRDRLVVKWKTSLWSSWNILIGKIALTFLSLMNWEKSNSFLLRDVNLFRTFRFGLDLFSQSKRYPSVSFLLI